MTIALGPGVAHWVAWQAFQAPSRAEHGPRGRFIFQASSGGGGLALFFGRRKKAGGPVEGDLTKFFSNSHVE